MHIIIIFLFINIINADEEDTKYVDLLPEKEKAEFLDQIARRILEEVETRDDKYRPSGELTDDELNKHNDYVRKIFEEESQNLRKNDVNKDLGIRVIPIDKKEENEDRYIDLTLRTDKKNNITKNGRRVFTGYVPNGKDSLETNNEGASKKKPADDESDVDIQVKNFRRGGRDMVESSNNNEDPKSSVIDDVNVENNNQNDRSSSEDTTQNTPNFDEIPTTEEALIFTETTELPKSFGISVKNSYENENNTSLDNYVAKETVKYEEVTMATLSDATSTVQALSVTESLSAQPKARFYRSYDENKTVDSHPNSNLENQNRNSTPGNQKDSKIINIEIESTTKKEDVSDLTTKISVTENLRYNEATTTERTATPTKIEALTTEQALNYLHNYEFNLQKNSGSDIILSTDNNNSKTNESIIEDVSSKQENAKSTEKLVHNMIDGLRENFLVETKQKDNNERKQLQAPNKFAIKKEYHVYEIPANSSPFLKINSKSKSPKKKAKEQPFYVPVYNYSPNNAFYNAHNRLGPNDSDGETEGTIKDDVKQKPIAWDYFFSDDYQKKFRFETKLKPKNQITQPQKINLLAVKNYSLIDSYVNPEDYSDVDYYNPNGKYGRSRNKNKKKKSNRDKCKPSESKEDEQSEEENKKMEKPVNSLSNIRQFLLEKQQMYIPRPSYLPEIPKSDEEKEEEEESELASLRNKYADRYYARSDEKLNFQQEQRGNKFAPNLIYLSPRRKRANSRTSSNKLLCDSKNKNCPFTAFIGFTAFIDQARSLIEEVKNDSQIEELKVESEDKPLSMLAKSKKKVDKEKEEANEQTDYETMRQILNMVDGRDIVPTLLKLQELNLKKKVKSRKTDTEKSGKNSDVNIYVNVINEMIMNENKALINYDWLGTAVDLQSAIKKINDMVKTIHYNDDIHPSDLELLKYLIYLHKTAKEETIIEKELRANKNYLPRNLKKKNRIVTDSGLIQNRVWLVRMVQLAIPKNDLKEFQKFMHELESALYDLHSAVKHLTMVTQYNRQNWFENIKQLQDFKRKQSLELLVHIFASRIVALIEKSAKNGLENDFMEYIQNNLADVEATEKEFVFLLRLLKELKHLI